MHIVIVNRWPRFDNDPIRWDNELTRYETYIDHIKHSVSYIVDDNGLQGVVADPQTIAGLERVDEVNDVANLSAACERLARKIAPIDKLVALSEFTLEYAAKVRLMLNIPGPRPQDVAAYRDKIRMKELISAAGLRAPRFVALTNTNYLEIAESWNYPLIAKPRTGAASIGIARIETRRQLLDLVATVDKDDYELEEFISGPIYHIDGYADADGNVVFQEVSVYVNDCLSFCEGKPLGSHTVAESPVKATIRQFSVDCCRVLGIAQTPFHLEVFWHNETPVFLEIGARVGGSEVPHVLNKVHGVNLFELWLREISGDDISRVPLAVREGRHGGFLTFPKSETERQRVTRVEPMRCRYAPVWRELLPAVGQILEPGGSYDAFHRGRYVFCAETEQEVRSTIEHIIATFVCDTETVS